MTRVERYGFAVVAALSALSVAMELAGAPGELIFVVAAVGVTGLAWALGQATEQAGESTGPRASALMNASFGNLPELVILVLAINAGLPDIARASIIGSVIGNILLILGLSLLLGGWRNGVQRFNDRVAAMNTSMLVLGVAGVGVPTLYFAVEGDAAGEQSLSRLTALVLLSCYAAYLYYQFATPGLQYTHEPSVARWGRRQAMALLALTAVGTGVVAEVLVSSIQPVIDAWGVPRTFIGLIVVPFVGNVAEHFAAVRLAYRDSLDFAMGIAFGSGIQIILAASSFAVFSSMVVGKELSLVFPALQIAALAGGAVVTTLVARGGETNWLEGLLLLAVYAIFAVAFWQVG